MSVFNINNQSITFKNHQISLTNIEYDDDYDVTEKGFITCLVKLDNKSYDFSEFVETNGSIDLTGDSSMFMYKNDALEEALEQIGMMHDYGYLIDSIAVKLEEAISY